MLFKDVQNACCKVCSAQDLRADVDADAISSEPVVPGPRFSLLGCQRNDVASEFKVGAISIRLLQHGLRT